MLGVLTMNIINFGGVVVDCYYGEGFSRTTGKVVFWGRILHVSVGKFYWNFHLWGITPKSPKWSEQYPEVLPD